MWLRKRRVRFHLVDGDPANPLPSVEGLLHSKSGREYIIAVPSLVFEVGQNPTELRSRFLAIPRERVAFYELI